MKKTIWIATSNAHKVEEFQTMLKDCDVKCLKDLDHTIHIIEDGTTFEENSYIKAKEAAKKVAECKRNCAFIVTERHDMVRRPWVPIKWILNNKIRISQGKDICW